MREFKILEQNWSQGKNKVDIIASKDNSVHFIEVSMASEVGITDSVNQSKLNKVKNAAEAWVLENKWSDSYDYSSVLLDEGYVVLGFNESFDY